ncbi:pentapeptide repeat-containing protein [Acetobacter fallax]|uniref:Uncharacterized protein n=1 Tax=Acetobacter fallax TaxID=1737473 RepID=A0ABX0K8Z6_9PROT|nr:pentapeptide repeat-containing protein [Acetobacter fallax]NHO32701.1 hypothetical protein [Acetobacter fallax]NHO36239.1 hypothetical protein [Acetobacter fallax]
MRKFAGIIIGLTGLACVARAQDYSTSPAQNSTHWDYSAGSRPGPSESYEGYPPPPAQVIISPGMYGNGYGGGAGNNGNTGNTGAEGQSGMNSASGPNPGVNGGVGWGNTGAGNTGSGNVGRGNTGVGNIGAGNTGWGRGH